LEFCHVFTGVKILGAATWADTPRLLLSRNDDDQQSSSPRAAAVSSSNEDDDTSEPDLWVPADRPLDEEELALLQCESVSLVMARPGDIAVFSSAAAHFATNGAAAPCAALFHGALTPAAIPRLCVDRAAWQPFTEEELSGDYAQHLTAGQLLAEYSADNECITNGLLGANVLLRQAAADLATMDDSRSTKMTPDATGLFGWRQRGDAERAEAVARYGDCVLAMQEALRSASQGAPPQEWLAETMSLFWTATETNVSAAAELKKPARHE
jgi:hypothetical protein